MSKYLITGAAGFLGARISEILLSSGHEITGVDNLNDNYDIDLKQHRLERFKNNTDFKFFKVDIRDYVRMHEIYNSSFKAVIHLAALSAIRHSVKEPRECYKINLDGTLNLLELSREFGLDKFVFASSSSVYKESIEYPLTEINPTDEPLSPYASSKKAAETLVYAYHHLHGLDASVIRYFTVYGPAGRPDMATFKFIQAITEEIPITLFGDGTQKRDFTHIDDAANGTISALKPLGYEIINLGTSHTITLTNIISIMERYIGKDAKINYEPKHPADVSITWANIDKAQQLLNWSPRVVIEDGIKSAVDWYKANRDWARNIH